MSALAWPELLARVDEAFAVLDGFITLRIDYLPTWASAWPGSGCCWRSSA